MAIKQLGAAISRNEDTVTKAYVASLGSAATGMLTPAQVVTQGSETYTISSGSVTQISGTTINGYSPAINDRVLIITAPASTGAGSAFSITTQPTNGIYTVTGNTTNLSMSRATDMSGSNKPGGMSVFAENGTWNIQSVWTVVTPATNAAFTYGTNNIQFASTGGTNPTFQSAYLTNASNTLGFYNGTGNTFIQTTASAGNQTLTLPATATSDTLVGRASTDTLVNKSLTSPTLTTPVLGTPSSGTLTNCTGLLVSGITASTSLALSVGSIELGHASDTTLSRASAGRLAAEGVNVVTISSTDTLTNKTLSSSTNTISSNDDKLTLAASSDSTKGAQLRVSTGQTASTTRLHTLPTVDSVLVGRDTTDTLTNKTLTDPKIASDIYDTNGNKIFGLSGQTSAVNWIFTANAATGSAPGLTSFGTDTNVGFDISTRGSGAFTFEGVPVVTTTATQTLTNKTLTNPTITNYTESVVGNGTATTTATISLTSGTLQTLTLTASTACTVTLPSATSNQGKSITVCVYQASGGAGTVTFTATGGVEFPGNVHPTQTSTGSTMDIWTFVAPDAAKWYGSVAQGYVP